jgi:hypothetical protein
MRRQFIRIFILQNNLVNEVHVLFMHRNWRTPSWNRLREWDEHRGNDVPIWKHNRFRL